MENLITDEAKRFKAFRLAENLTQEELGEALGKTKSWINKVENGSRRITLTEVSILRKKFDMSYEWFYEGKGKRVESGKDENLLTVTTALKNEVDLLKQKVEKQDQIIKKLVRDFYAKD
ncbi:helix-turn-helix domain-containing protein [Sphingobacterium yanglingense]|nr:helix-turn-helix transcriptional regulator [Sphingobacterium yanglingense]